MDMLLAIFLSVLIGLIIYLSGSIQDDRDFLRDLNIRQSKKD